MRETWTILLVPTDRHYFNRKELFLSWLQCWNACIPGMDHKLPHFCIPYIERTLCNDINCVNYSELPGVQVITLMFK